MIRSLQYAFIAIVTISVGFSLYQWNASRASTQKTAPNNGLVGYWSFNEGTGTLAGDASVNKNTGTLTNGPTWVAGKLGQAINFDGVDDFVNLGTNPPWRYNTAGTVSMWVKPSPTGVNQLFAKGGDTTVGSYENTFEIAINGGGMYLRMYTTPNNKVLEAGGAALPTNTWTHVVLTQNGSGLKQYINGTESALSFSTGNSSSPYWFNTVNTAREHYIGGFKPYTAQQVLLTQMYQGSLDDVRIYNRALSGTEITNLYNLGAEKLNVSPVSNLTSGLVGYWTFDGKDTPWSSSSAATATDRSGNSNTGTLTNMSRATSPAEGKLGQALNFDGVDDYASIPHSASICPASISVTMWMKLNALTTTTVSGGSSVDAMYPLSKGNLAGTNDGYTFYKGVSHKLSFAINSYVNIATSSTSLAVGKWYLVTGTYDGSNIKIYVDGSLEGITAYAGGSVSCGGSLIIGRRHLADAYNSYFNGQIDEVRIYNRALSAGEIQSLYDLGTSDKVNSSVSQNQGTGRLDSGLVGYWPLDDGSGTNANDASTSNNDGTLIGGPTWVSGNLGQAVNFNGGQRIAVSTAPSLNLTGTLTLSAWVYKNTTGGCGNFDDVLSKADNNAGESNYELSTYGGCSGKDYIIFNYTNSGDHRVRGDTTLLSSSTWYHLVVVYNDVANKIDLYVNGILQTKTVLSGNPESNSLITNSQSLTIGARDSNYYAGFPGRIDEVRVYNRALSVDEVSQLYRLTAPTGVDTSLKGYWSFNGPDLSGTTAYDRSGAGNTGTLTNGPTITEGKLGQALNFDYSNDYVNIGTPASLDLRSQNSVAAWVKTDKAQADISGSRSQVIYASGAADCCGTDYYLNLEKSDGGGYYKFRYVLTDLGDYIISSSTVEKNRWYHVVGTYDGVTGRLYVDGVLNSSAAQSGPLTDRNNQVYIGRGVSGTNSFSGIIDEVRIYNRALSSTEISALYNAGR